MGKDHRPEAGINQIIKGTVVKVVTKENKWGDIKRIMQVRGKGWLLSGTIPDPLIPKIGDRVQLKARVSWSKNHANFGFYFGPTGAAILAEEE